MQTIRKILLRSTQAGPHDGIRQATGSAYCYTYRELPRQATPEQISNYCAVTRRLFAPIAKAFGAQDNSLWVLRHYLALKFVTAASLLAGSAQYAFERNLLIGVPYFNYYAVLNACRAYLLTSPHVKWDEHKTVEMTHENILNRTAEYMRALDPARRLVWRERLAALRDHRELFSYRFPLSGPDLIGREVLDPGPVTELACLIAELASINSECFQASLEKHASDELDVPPIPDHTWSSVYELAGSAAADPLDRERFGKFVRGWKTVSTLEVMAYDGLMEDIYGSWTDADPIREDAFDPDDYSRLLLVL
ncbi:hypothetical protein [Mesorhizobium sp. M0522]|uniref:hypothetical protein n=1 Tax=unclassified Mesorhizobium TaxID=325217 RepID=UPI003339406A